MREKKILVVWDLTDKQRKLLEECCPEADFCYVPGEKVTEETVKDVNVILGNVSPQLLRGADKLEWVQLNSAGANGYCEPGILPEQAVLTNASGAYGLAISEHMIGMLLMLKKKLNRYYDNQKNHVWQDEGMVTGIWNSTTLVLGMGNLGSEFAKRMHALGSHVIGVRRTLKEKQGFWDAQYQMEQLEELLPKADVVALCLPGTSDTNCVMDEYRLSLMKKSAILVNVGRGGLVDNLALAKALQEGGIAGAAVDVTEPEPLPENHPLWSAPNMLITPHVSGGYHMKETFELILQITEENLRSYQSGTALHNQVNRRQGY